MHALRHARDRRRTVKAARDKVHLRFQGISEGETTHSKATKSNLVTNYFLSSFILLYEWNFFAWSRICSIPSKPMLHSLHMYNRCSCAICWWCMSSSILPNLSPHFSHSCFLNNIPANHHHSFCSCYPSTSCTGCLRCAMPVLDGSRTCPTCRCR